MESEKIYRDRRAFLSNIKNEKGFKIGKLLIFKTFRVYLLE
jgi:hypothetical protein